MSRLAAISNKNCKMTVYKVSKTDNPRERSLFFTEWDSPLKAVFFISLLAARRSLF
jgi:hypothetical protein